MCCCFKVLLLSMTSLMSSPRFNKNSFKNHNDFLLLLRQIHHNHMLKLFLIFAISLSFKMMRNREQRDQSYIKYFYSLMESRLLSLTITYVHTPQKSELIIFHRCRVNGVLLIKNDFKSHF